MTEPRDRAPPSCDSDAIDRLVEGCGRERDDLDFSWLELISRFRDITTLLRAEVAGILPGSNCGNSEFAILIQLRAAGPPYRMRPTEIFQALSVTSGAVTSRIEKLARLGWVSREASTSDRRATWVRLSEAGLRVSDLLMEHGAAHSRLAAALTGLDPAERQELVRLTSKLCKAFP
jgi:DNA-binding MarR family transcriptional regulator